MKTLKILEKIGFALIIIGFLIDAKISDDTGTPMSFFGDGNNYIFLIGIVVWAISFGIRKVEERKARGE
jgi:hypothetical protein